MRTYIISVAGAAVLSAVINMLSPERWGKYIGVLTGLVVAATIVRPILSLADKDFFSDIQIKTDVASETGMDVFYSELRAELENRVAGDIKERLLHEFGTDSEVSVEARAAKDGRISGIGRITVHGGRLDNAAAARLYDIYDAEEVIINEHKKVYKKTE